MNKKIKIALLATGGAVAVTAAFLIGRRAGATTVLNILEKAMVETEKQSIKTVAKAA